MLPLMKSYLPPFKSFVLKIISRNQLIFFLEKYFLYSERINYITLESFLVNPRTVNDDHMIIRTLYSIKIWMGSIKEYPAVSQLQYILRLMIMNHSTAEYYEIFAEFVINVDVFMKHKHQTFRMRDTGYRFYAHNPLLFLKMVQISNDEKKKLCDMMRADGISIPEAFSLPLSDTKMKKAQKKLWALQHYFNHCNFFNYKFLQNIHWVLTQDQEIYEKWLNDKKYIKHRGDQLSQHPPWDWSPHPPWDWDSNDYPAKNLISLVPHITNYKEITLYSNFRYFRVFDDGEYDYDNLFDGVYPKCIDRVYHESCWKKGFPNEVSRYEFIARMTGKLPEHGHFYIEIVTIVSYQQPNLNTKVLFITRNPQLFMRVIQMGKKKEICNFIIRDEGLKPLQANPSNSLQSKCISVWVNHIIERRNPQTNAEWLLVAHEEIQTNSNVPPAWKCQLMNEGQQRVITLNWQRGIEDVTLFYLLDSEWRGEENTQRSFDWATG